MKEMKDKILDLKFPGTKGDSMIMVKFHNMIIESLAVFSEKDEWLAINEIFILRNQLQSLIDDNNLDINE